MVSLYSTWSLFKKMRQKIRTLLVDDSDVFIDTLHEILKNCGEIEVVGTANNAYEARDKIIQQRPQVIILDIFMPRMDGLQFLRKLMPQYPLPVIIVSSRAGKNSRLSYEALEYGAIDCLLKPKNIEKQVQEFGEELIEKIVTASKADVSRFKNSEAKTQEKPFSKLNKRDIDTILIGASTGGTEAIKTVLSSLPKDMPGIVIVQHMPKDFIPLFAQTLSCKTPFKVLVGESGMNVKKGQVILAPGDLHTTIHKQQNTIFVRCFPGEKVNGHKPSVDVLFESAAENLKNRAAAVLLTGMGADGAAGMRRMKDNDSITIAQDKESSVVYGMPNEAVKLNAVQYSYPLSQIPNLLINLFHQK